MLDISLENNWLELKTISLGAPSQDNQALTIADLLEWAQNSNSWHSMICKVKLAWQGKGWLNRDIIDSVLHRLSWQKLERIRSLIRKIQKIGTESIEDSIQVLNQIEILDLMVRNEKLRREHNAEKTLMFFDHISLEDLIPTSLFSDYKNQAKDFGKIIDPILIKRSFFKFLKEQLASCELDQERLDELNNLLKNADRVIYEIVKHEYNSLINVESALATYQLLLKSHVVTGESLSLVEVLVANFETLLNSMQKFYGELFDTAQMDDRVHEVAKLFQSEDYFNYTDALSGVTRLYFKFLKQENALRASLALLEKQLSDEKISSWEILAPLAYFKIIPAHRNQLEHLLETDSAHPEIGVSLEVVQGIQARWFNH